ncbi:AEC family transporter [Nocardia sp. NPDC050793]|uniref:AEC family transporter n=1 Tax=Nocardia sp. NPDC050793 TaxID=3155159 RepID=UPI0033D5B677
MLVLTVIVLTIMESATSSENGAARRIAASIGRSLTTPVVVGCTLGITLNAAHAPVPPVVLSFAEFLCAAASPVALLALGLHIGGSPIRWRGTLDENTLIAVKCVAFPVLMLTAMHLAGVAEPWRQYLVLIAAMPAPQNLFIFAQTYDSDTDLAASVVIRSTLCSLALLPAWQLLLA